MSDFKRFLELETKEEQRAFIEGLSQAERLQLWSEYLQVIHQVVVDVLAPVFAEFHAAIERFIEVCEISGIDLTQPGGGNDQKRERNKSSR